MDVVDEIVRTFLYGIGAIGAVGVLILLVVVAGGMLLYVPGWLIIEMGYYLVGTLYTVFVWGAFWRLTE